MTLIIHGSNMSWRFHAGQITPMKVERIMLGITLSWYIWCAIWPPRNVLELTKLPNFRMTVGVALFEVCLSDCSLETGKCLLKECQHFYPVSFKQTYIIAARLKGQLFWYPRISFLRLSVGSFLFLFFVFLPPNTPLGDHTRVPVSHALQLVTVTSLRFFRANLRWFVRHRGWHEEYRFPSWDERQIADRSQGAAAQAVPNGQNKKNLE